VKEEEEEKKAKKNLLKKVLPRIQVLWKVLSEIHVLWKICLENSFLKMHSKIYYKYSVNFVLNNLFKYVFHMFIL